jgi:hypothetical protein
VLLAVSMMTVTALPGVSYGQDDAKEEGYIRKVDSRPPLSEMEKDPGWSYNTDYLFAVSRAVRDSSLPPAGKVPLFIPAIVVDIALCPFALIGGLFGE